MTEHARAERGYSVERTDQPDKYVVVRRCPFCEELAKTPVPGQGLWNWEHGAFVQNAFPDLTADDREQLMSGIHPACWDEVMDQIGSPEMFTEGEDLELQAKLAGKAFCIDCGGTFDAREDGEPVAHVCVNEENWD